MATTKQTNKTKAKGTAVKTASGTKPAKREKVDKLVFRITTDDQSIVNLAALCRYKRLKQSDTIASLVKELTDDKKLTAKFLNFYLNRWPDIEPRTIRNQMLFSFVVETIDAIKSLSWDVIGKSNQSLTVRVLLAFFVEHYAVPPLPTPTAK
jgi:hypothetical protein